MTFVYTPEHVIAAIFLLCIVLFLPAVYVFVFSLLAIDWFKRKWAKVFGRMSNP